MRIRPTLMLLACVVIVGCETKRIEYRKRPAYVRMMGGNTDPVTVCEDGTEIHWIDQTPRDVSAFEQTIGNERIQLRIEEEDGTVQLRNVLPMHLVINLLECLQRSEYEVIWTQLITSEQRAWYVAQGETGYQSFVDWMSRHRKQLATLLNRMKSGKIYGEVIISTENGSGTVALRPSVAYDFKLKAIDIRKESDSWRLQQVR